MERVAPSGTPTPAPELAPFTTLLPSRVSATVRPGTTAKGVGPNGEDFRSMVAFETVTAQSASTWTQ